MSAVWLQESFDFGQVYLGAFARMPLTLVNTTPVPARLMLDLVRIQHPLIPFIPSWDFCLGTRVNCFRWTLYRWHQERDMIHLRKHCILSLMMLTKRHWKCMSEAGLVICTHVYDRLYNTHVNSNAVMLLNLLEARFSSDAFMC